jgi:hypothetical protein
MRRKSFVKQIEVNSGGGFRLSVYKQTYDDGGKLIHEEPHRITIDIEDDFDAVIAMNNTSLAQMGYPAIDQLELDMPREMRGTAHQHPAVAERIGIETAKRQEERRLAAEERAAVEEAEEKRRAKEAEEREAAAEQVKADFDAAVEAAVAKALGKA